MSVVLIGYRGSGKTTIGRKLAERLWQKFVDVDDLIAASAGKSIKEIFEQDGEDHFRDLEAQAVRNVSQLNDHVIGLGGGTLMRQESRRILKEAGHRLIYLRCEPGTLLQRIQSDPQSAQTRPNLTALGGGIEEITHMLSQREPVYREVADAELDVTHLTPDEAVVHIVRMM
ncbi:MAG TPA: shikimate kinase [Tepidisphaeraceae bacterium]|jgi:shikimate kinase